MQKEIDLLFLNSQLCHDFSRELNRTEIEFISFDVFDTLLRRKCEKPSDIFVEVANRALEQKVLFGVSKSDYLNIRLNAESVARGLSEKEDIKFDEIFMQMFFDQETIASLKKIELEVENDFLFVDPIAIQLLQLAYLSGKKIIITSDMYLPGEFLKNIIESKIPKHITFNHYFISSETGKTKTTGSQFLHICDLFKVKSESILHIGDNYLADVKSAGACGLKALFFNVPNWVAGVFDRERALQVNLDINIVHARLFSALLLPKDLSQANAFYYYYGCVIHGPTLAGFTKWILSYSEVIGANEIFCIMREGDIYQRCLKKIQPSIDASKFYASRKSTYLASLNDKNYLKNLLPVLPRSTYTLNDLYEEFDLGIIPVKLKKFAHTTLNTLESVSLGDELVIKLIHLEVKKQEDKIKNIISNSKVMLNNYFQQVRKTDLPFVFIDFGAGGTIQKQLHFAVEEKAEGNLIFYANSRAYKNSNHQHIASFLPFNSKTEKSINIISRSPEILEIMLVGEEQTTLGYKVDVKGDVLPVQPQKSYSFEHRDKIKTFNIGIDAYFELSELLVCDESTESSRESFALLLERLINVPTKEEAQHLGELTHEDNFGSDIEYNVIRDEEITELSSQPIESYWRKHCANPMKYLNENPWPQGVVTLVDDHILPDLYHLKDYKNKHNDSINLIIKNLMSIDHTAGVIVYGAGEFFYDLEVILKLSDIKITCVIDKKANFGDYIIKGYKVISLDKLPAKINIPIVVASKAFLTEIRTNINYKLGGNVVIISC